MQLKKTTKIWHIYSLRFQSLAGTQRYKRGFVKSIYQTFQTLERSSLDFSLFTYAFSCSLSRSPCFSNNHSKDLRRPGMVLGTRQATDK